MDNQARFREISCTVLGGLAGLMIAAPLSVGLSQLQGFLLLTSFTALGVLCGYRRRKNMFFFYFLLISVSLLAWLISFRLMQLPEP